MKKAIAVLMVFVLAFSLCGCKPYNHKAVNNAVKKAESLGTSTIQLDCIADSYNMDLTLDTEKDILKGTVTVSIKNRSTYSFNELYFNLYSIAMTEDAEITSAKDLASGKELKVSKEGSDCTECVELEDALATNSRITLELAFSETVSDNNTRCSHIKVGDGKVYSMMMCFPMLTAHYDGEWKLRDYFENGEVACGQKTSITATLKCPEDYKVLASGHQSTQKGVTKIEAKNVSELAIVASDVMTIDTFNYDGVMFRMCHIPYGDFNSNNLSRYYELAKHDARDSFSLYSEKIGKYVYDEIDIVPFPETCGAAGMEMPGLITYSLLSLEDVMFDQESVEDEIHQVVSHEMAHQWFYQGVMNDQFSEPWLDESFAAFLEAYYCEEEIEPSRGYINLDVTKYHDEDYGIVYENGAAFLNDLKNAMGEEMFFKMLSDWYTPNTKNIVRGRNFVIHVTDYIKSHRVKEEKKESNSFFSSVFSVIFKSRKDRQKDVMLESVKKIINKYISSKNL